MRVILVLLPMFVSCANDKITDDEREWRAAMDRENWYNCSAAYARQNVFTVSTHTHDRHRTHKAHEIKDDLRTNNCKVVLGKEWIYY